MTRTQRELEKPVDGRDYITLQTLTRDLKVNVSKNLEGNW